MRGMRRAIEAHRSIEENRILRQQIGDLRMRFNNNPAFAALQPEAKQLSRKCLVTNRDDRDTGNVIGVASETDHEEI